MSIEGDYITAKDKVLRGALRVLEHQFDPAEDPGWQAELDDEFLDDAVVEMAGAIRLRENKRIEQELNEEPKEE